MVLRQPKFSAAGRSLYPTLSRSDAEASVYPTHSYFTTQGGPASPLFRIWPPEISMPCAPHSEIAVREFMNLFIKQQVWPESAVANAPLSHAAVPPSARATPVQVCDTHTFDAPPCSHHLR